MVEKRFIFLAIGAVLAGILVGLLVKLVQGEAVEQVPEPSAFTVASIESSFGADVDAEEERRWSELYQARPGVGLINSSHDRLGTDYTSGRSDLLKDYASAQAEAEADRAFQTVVLPRAALLRPTLLDIGVSEDEVQQAVEAIEGVISQDLMPDDLALEYIIKVDANTSVGTLDRLRFRPSPKQMVRVDRNAERAFEATLDTVEVERRYAAAAGIMTTSLFAAAMQAQIPPDVMIKFANLFVYDVDFARDIERGDRFEIVFDIYYDTQGRYAGAGEVQFAAMTWRGGRKARAYYRFDEATDYERPYFTVGGESISRLLVKTPIDGARVTSGFGLRTHPISGFQKGHNGVDFAAPRGTPVLAAGDGTVIRRAPTGTWGNFIEIEHRGGYTTRYAHLDGYAEDLAEGDRVRQGDVIGFLGSTGRSTGPHLHYEVLKDGTHLNPMTLDVAHGRVLAEEQMDQFHAARGILDTVRLRPLTVAQSTEQ